MNIKTFIGEQFQDYKYPSMLVAFSECSFKCEKEREECSCHNSPLAQLENVWIDVNNLVEIYSANPISKALVCGGLEPFDTWGDLIELITEFRKKFNDDIVIYTGYYPDEIPGYICSLRTYPNIIIKFGRYIPDQESVYDEVLGVTLASPNQYAERIS